MDTSASATGDLPAGAARAAGKPALTVTDLDGQVPPGIGPQLDELYGSIYSTLDQFELDGALDGASTFAVTQDGRPKSLLLYRREGSLVSVLNRQVALPREEVERFAYSIFEKYAGVSAIRLDAVQADLRGTRHPWHGFHCAEDIVARLPGSADGFHAALGRNMRETVRRYTNKVRRSHPDFRLEFHDDAGFDEEQVAALYALHCQRIGTRNMVSNVTPERFRRIMAMVRRRGMVAVATIGGRVAGGLILWRTGTHYVMRIIAHDSRYDELKLGTVCCYLTMLECIARGATHFHFMAGRMLYKTRLLGVEQGYDQVVIYRNRFAMLRHARLAGGAVLRGALRELRVWLQDAERDGNPRAQPLLRCVRAWRHARALLRARRHPAEQRVPASCDA